MLHAPTHNVNIGEICKKYNYDIGTDLYTMKIDDKTYNNNYKSTEELEKALSDGYKVLICTKLNEDIIEYILEIEEWVTL